ncbi:hypothetical protein MHTCC0001_35870 [Flavobacteriaceae bacterium MHTCC 0001]
MEKELNEVKDNSIQNLNNSINWYTAAANRHRRYSLFLSYISIFFTVIGIIAPLIDNVVRHFYKNTEDYNSIIIYIGYLSLGVAGGIQLYDRVIGNTNSWIRFIKTELELKKIKHLFLGEWETMRFTFDFNNVSKEEVNNLLNLISLLNKEVYSLIENETNSWADTYTKGLSILNEKIATLKTEFDEDIKKIEQEKSKELKEKNAANDKAASDFGFLKIEIKNSHDFERLEVQLFTDEMKSHGDKEVLTNGSQDVIFPKLKTGKYILNISSIKNEDILNKKMFVDVKKGAVTVQSITIPIND